MLKLSNELDLPIAAVTQTFAFLGKRGGGKTYAAGKLAEELLTQRAQIIAIDVVGVWYGLRIPKDPAGKPFDLVIFGGKHGDVPINYKAGKIVARAILERNLSAVVDISEFIHSEQVRFCFDFLTELFEYRKEHPAACHLFVEEAQELVPQNPPPKAQGENYAARLMHIGNRVVKLGRNFGIGCSLISQRPQEVNKKVLDMCEVVLAFQMTGLSPRKTITDIAKDEEIDIDINALLPKLEVGQAFVWSPSWLKISGVYKIGEKITADVSATPVFGAEPVETQRLAPVDVADLSKTIAELTADAESTTPAALKKQIADLQKQINEARKSGNSTVVEVEVEKQVAVFPLEAISDVDDIGTRAWEIEQALTEQLSVVKRLYNDILEFGNKYKQYPVSSAGPITTPWPSNERPKQETRPVDRRERPANVTDRPKSTLNVKTGAISNGHLPEGERKILTAIAQYTDRGGADREQISILSGYKKSSRDTYISRLSRKGLIVVGSQIVATSEGIDALGDFQPLPAGLELQKYWLDRLPEGEMKILDGLLNYGRGSVVDRETISEFSGYKKSSRDTYISRLRVRKLVEVTRDGVKASDTLFAR